MHEYRGHSWPSLGPNGLHLWGYGCRTGCPAEIVQAEGADTEERFATART